MVARGSGGWEGRRWGVCTRTMMGISYIQLYQRHYSGCDVALWAPNMSPLGEIGKEYMGFLCIILPTTCESTTISK